MQVILLSVVLFSIAELFLLVCSFSTGAPESKCASMSPGHFLSPQTGPCPFVTAVDKVNVTGGEEVKITLHSPFEKKLFKGFLVMIRRPGADNSFGHFREIGVSEHAQGVNCFGNKNSAMTHRSSDEKSSVTLRWIAPKIPHDEDLDIVVTYVENFFTFWEKVLHKTRIRVTRTLGESIKNEERNPEQNMANRFNEGLSFFSNIFNSIFSSFRNPNVK